MKRTLWKSTAVAAFALVLATPLFSQGNKDTEMWQRQERWSRPAAEAPKPDAQDHARLRDHRPELAPLWAAGRDIRTGFHQLEIAREENTRLREEIARAQSQSTMTPERIHRLERMADLQEELLTLRRQEFLVQMREQAPDASRRLNEFCQRMKRMEDRLPEKRLEQARENLERMRQLMEKLATDEPVDFEEVATVLSQMRPPDSERDGDPHREQANQQVQRVQREIQALSSRLDDLRREMNRLQGDYFGFNQENDWQADLPPDHPERRPGDDMWHEPLSPEPNSPAGRDRPRRPQTSRDQPVQ